MKDKTDMNIRGVDPDLLREFKKCCIDENKPMKFVVQDLMAQFVKQSLSKGNTAP